jgi:hypothetical protein
MKPFLLRFEEETVEDIIARIGSQSVQGTVVAGTQTLTEVRKEGADKDPNVDEGVAFPR